MAICWGPLVLASLTRSVVLAQEAAYLAAMTILHEIPADSINETFSKLAEDFDQLRAAAAELDLPARDFIDDHVIDLGKKLVGLPDSARIPENKVPGCVANVWIISEQQSDRLYFLADSDSIISKGNIALLLSLYSGRSPREILEFDANGALNRLGLPQALSRGRANGLNSMVGRIRQQAMAAAAP